MEEGGHPHPLLCAKLPRDSSSTKYPPWLSNSCHKYSPKDVQSLGKLSHETGKKTPKSLVRFARLKPVTIFSQCKQFMKLLSLKENFSKISEAKQWHTRSEREKRKKMSTFSYSFISLEALQDVKKIQFQTSNRRVSKMCVILLLWNRRKGETVLISDYSSKVREYFWKWFLSSWMKNIEKCEKRNRKPLVSWKSPSIYRLIPPNEHTHTRKRKMDLKVLGRSSHPTHLLLCWRDWVKNGSRVSSLKVYGLFPTTCGNPLLGG